jgi:hypothetical protein
MLRKTKARFFSVRNPNSIKFSALMPVDEVDVAIIDNKNAITANSNNYSKNSVYNEEYNKVTIVVSIVLLTIVVRTIVLIITVIPLLLRAATVVVRLPKIISRPPPATILVTRPQK